MSTAEFNRLFTGPGRPVGEELRQTRLRLRRMITEALRLAHNAAQELEKLSFERRYRIQQLSLALEDVGIWHPPFINMPGVHEARERLMVPSRRAVDAYVAAANKPRGIRRRTGPTPGMFEPVRRAEHARMLATIQWLQSIQPDEDQ